MKFIHFVTPVELLISICKCLYEILFSLVYLYEIQVMLTS